jgi:predicted CoA-binding protein
MEAGAIDFTKVRKIAVVGVSNRKFGGFMYKSLRKRGFEVYPVHPTRETFAGDHCFDRLTSLPDKVDMAVVAVSPLAAEQVTQDAIEANVPKLWYQQGPNFTEVAAKAEQAGIATVTSKCVLMYAAPVTGIHAVHRWLARLLGRL